MIRSVGTLRWVILASVVASRLVYAISWFDISPALLDISREFSVDPSLRGIIASAFILGVGLFQVPAGWLAARWGAKRTALSGLMTMAIAGVLSSVSPNFLTLIITRFLVGIGAAFFFAPAIGIITPLFRVEEEGFVIGLYNGAFGVGAGIGLFGWSALDEVVGWRLGLAVAGIITALLALENYVVIRENSSHPRARGLSARSVISSRSVWFWALGLLGFWGALYSASYFLHDFAVTQLSLDSTNAGLLAALISLVSVFGGPVGGKLSDHFKSRKLFMLLPAALFGLGVMAVGITSTPYIWILSGALGFTEGFVFAALYSGASQLPEVGSQFAPLAIGLINSVQILGSFWMPAVFTILAESTGYPSSWLFLGITTIFFLPLVAITKEPFGYESSTAHKNGSKSS